ncbi:hypothetical protein GEOBRER4_n2624 [Citrifermentans bremense]|uniref:Glycosyl transferase family 1 domain-containing protein n=1 Tax=Citrifermentans bremense TaxID=60035 RepID=A0A6S6M0D8_9BACT|nr:glycosyltransferase [Citrifermentans bremense]BCG47777.1 hypothetical protein GEOBRER4_n2624 [Citrifermentans bremense]
MKLLVIGEVSVVDNRSCNSRNGSFDARMLKYTEFFDSLVYFGPGQEKILELDDSKKLSYCSTAGYNKSIIGRSKLLHSSEVKENLLHIIHEFSPDLIELRVPSIFTLYCYHVVKNLKIPLMCYVAGEWSSSFAANYKFPFSSWLGNRLERTLEPIIKQCITVVTGHVLKNKYSGLADCYPYYSTTHDEVHVPTAARNNTLIYLGRLEKLKRVDLAIHVLKHINDLCHIPFRLKIYGNGPEKKGLVELSAKLGVREYVDFSSYERDRAKLRIELLSAKYLLLLSKSEGTSKVLPEAMAHGVIPVAIRGVGSNDFILNDNNGLLCDSDAHSIAASIMSVESNASCYSNMVSACYKYAKAHTLDNEQIKMWEWVFCKMKELDIHE